MSRDILPFIAPDVSALAKALNRELALAEGRPGHVQLLNMLARATGYRNFQHFRAATMAEERLAEPLPSPEPLDFALVERVSGHFDAEGRLVRWPSRYGHQSLALWVLWSRLEAGTIYNEFEISVIIRNAHLFGDHALIRRPESGRVDRPRGLAQRLDRTERAHRGGDLVRGEAPTRYAGRRRGRGSQALDAA